MFSVFSESGRGQGDCLALALSALVVLHGMEAVFR